MDTAARLFGHNALRISCMSPGMYPDGHTQLVFDRIVICRIPRDLLLWEWGLVKSQIRRSNQIVYYHTHRCAE